MNVGALVGAVRARSDGKESELQVLSRQNTRGFTVFLQQGIFPASPEKCRAEWWPMTEKSARMKREELRQSVKDGIAIVEFIIPEFRGNRRRQKSVHAYLGSRDLCAEVHLSKDQSTPEDQRLFDEVLGTARLLPDKSRAMDQTHNPKDRYLAEGSQLYLERNYSAASERYQKALDLEKQDRTLGKSFFRLLVDNLGMSYGLTEELSNARETSE